MLCGKLLNFNYKLFGGEIQEMGWYQTSGQRQTGTGATSLVISFQPTFKQYEVFGSHPDVNYTVLSIEYVQFMLQMYISVMKSHVNMCHSQFRGSLSLSN